MAAHVEPFRIHVPDPVLADLDRRLAATRWPPATPGGGWDQGTELGWLRELCDYWATGYDWRAEERRLNALPQVKVRVGPMEVHCVHRPGVGPSPVPLVLTHGWPSTFDEMHKVVEPLADPGAHGGDPADAFDVVVPSLPGYGFSSPPVEWGFGVAAVADLWVAVMDALGYRRFGAHGADWGSAVGTALAASHPERLVGIHLSMVAPPVDEARLDRAQRAWWERVQRYRAEEWGYVHLQRTRPQSVAVGLTDSPVGLAAWILEKWWRWSHIVDEHGHRDLWRRYTRDELLATVMLYWVTATIGPSIRLYRESFGPGAQIRQPPRIEVPTGFALLDEPNAPPRELVEPHYAIHRWSQIPGSGHFPAMENPGALVEELRAFFRPLR